ncbi:MAG TPA: hypothetical protein VIB38_11730, partial [Aestuariivirgaceae bacterium]
GGEGGEKAAASMGGDDVRYLTLLGLVEGHLRAGLELYRQGAADMARTHMKHPGDELYADLEPALSARKAAGFGPSLEALAAAVENGKPIAEAEKAFSAVMEEIDKARATIDDLPDELKSLMALIRTAADEYAVGVKEGKVTDPHEYQDAWGFTQTAKAQLAKRSEADRKRLGQSYEQIAGELNKLDAAWPSLVPPDKVTTDASVIYGAAARIEIAALAVK